jgi:SAM-dependent methyltransferase
MDRYYETPAYISHSNTKKGVMNRVYHWVRSYMLWCKTRLVEREAHRRTGRLLDIGAGTGYFADAMRLREWEVEAVERNKHARLFAKEHFDLTIQSETALLEYTSGAFDVITLWHVMEHLENLNETWEQLNTLLGEKGTLVIAVPNNLSYDADVYGAYWAAYDVPRHLWHFTPSTMQQFGSKHGFALASYWPMPFDAFYVSMLSEQYKNHSCAFLRGAVTGLKAWFHAWGNKEKSSSIIYVFRKKGI